MIKVLTAALIASTTLMAVSPAMAWGPREQGIVTGIVGTIVAQQIFRPPVVVAPPPVYAGPPMVPYYPGTVYPNYTYRPMYKSVDVFIQECNCYRTMQVRVN